MDKIKEAYKIAKKCLRGCYTDKGILAGKSLWFDYWARDSFYASWGSLELKDYEQVKKNLLFFISYQKKNGQIPLRVDSYAFLLKLIGIKFNRGFRARYLEDKMKSYPRDQNSLFLIAAFSYIKKTEDKKFAKKYFKNFEKAIEWNLSKDKDDDFLLEEYYYATWADSLRKKGKVLYTNVLHSEALKSFAEICRILGYKDKSTAYYKLHEQVKEEINRIFWNGQHYADWYDWKGHNFFSSDGNILAIIFGIADYEKSGKIISFIKEFEMENFTLDTNFPKYAPWNISFSLRMAGIPDYHNGIKWLWLGCIDVIAKSKLGMKKEAKELLTKIAEKIIEYGSVYEVYEKNGKPVYRTFFKSESSFAWSSGLFILAAKSF